MRRDDYEALGGHMDHIMPIEEAVKGETGLQKDHLLDGLKHVNPHEDNVWPVSSKRKDIADG